MSSDIAANEIYKLRNEIARLNGQTNWVCKCGGTDCEGQKENAALRVAAIEICALARVWVTVWGDKLSAESIKRLEQLEKQILKEAQP